MTVVIPSHSRLVGRNSVNMASPKFFVVLTELGWGGGGGGELKARFPLGDFFRTNKKKRM